MKTKRLMVAGILVEFLTLSQIALLSGKKTGTLKKWQEKSWFPQCNFRTPAITLKDGTKQKGMKLYSLKYALLMVEEIKKVKRGVEIDNEVKRQLFILMKEENKEYSTIKT